MQHTLIITADDFGITPAISRGMMDLALAGRVHRLSLLSNMPGTETALSLAVQSPHIPIGLHVNLTEGLALSGPISGVTDNQGRFLPRKQLLWRCLTGRIERKALRNEILAQLERITANGVKVWYLDSHQHIHIFPVISRELVQLAEKHGLKIRYPATGMKRPLENPAHLGLRFLLSLNPVPTGLRGNDCLSSIFDLPVPVCTLENYQRILQAVPAHEIHELMVHPYVTDTEGLAAVYPGQAGEHKQNFFRVAFEEFRALSALPPLVSGGNNPGSI